MASAPTFFDEKRLLLLKGAGAVLMEPQFEIVALKTALTSLFFAKL
jgi:hypothetical protein